MRQSLHRNRAAGPRRAGPCPAPCWMVTPVASPLLSGPLSALHSREGATQPVPAEFRSALGPLVWTLQQRRSLGMWTCEAELRVVLLVLTQRMVMQGTEEKAVLKDLVMVKVVVMVMKIMAMVVVTGTVRMILMMHSNNTDSSSEHLLCAGPVSFVSHNSSSRYHYYPFVQMRSLTFREAE